MKQYFFTILVVFAATPARANDDIWKFSEPPMFTSINRPEKNLTYDLCLFRLIPSVEGEADDLGVRPATGKKVCESESDINSRSAAQIEADNEDTRVFDPPALRCEVKTKQGGKEAVTVLSQEECKKQKAQMKYKGITRTWQAAKVVGFFYNVKKAASDKGTWDSFCVAQIRTVDSGEEDETLLVCNRETVPAGPNGKAVFTCPGIEKCISQLPEHKVDEPNQIGSVVGEATKKIQSDGSTSSTSTDGSNSDNTPGRTHKTK